MGFVPGRRLLQLVTIVFVFSLLAPMVGLTTAQEATPGAPPVEEVTPPPQEATTPSEVDEPQAPAALPTNAPPAPLPTDVPVVEGPTLAPAPPTEAPPPPATSPTLEPTEVQQTAPSASTPNEQPPAESPVAPPSSQVPVERQAQDVESLAEGELTLQVVTNDAGNPDGLVITIQSTESGVVASFPVDATGAATTWIPFGTYHAVTDDPHGIYDQAIVPFSFESSGQVVSITVETYIAYGSVQFVATTSDGGTATQSLVTITNFDNGTGYPSRWIGEDNTVTFPRLTYGLYEYVVEPGGIYEGTSGLFAISAPTLSVPLSLTALPHGTLTLDGSTSDGGSAQGAYVLLHDQDGQFVRYGFLDENHDVSFDRILPGTYGFEVYPYHIYNGFKGTLTLASDAATATFILEAKPTSTLTVTVSTSDGGSAEGAAVELVDESSNVVWGYLDGNNQAVMETVIRGTYEWRMRDYRIYQGASGTITLDDPEESLVVDLAAQPHGSVSITLVTSDGETPFYPSVTLSREGGATYSTWFNNTNQAVIEHVVHGTYTWTFAADGWYREASGEVTVAGDTTTLEIALEAIPNGTLVLNGATSDGEDASHVAFSVSSVGDGQYRSGSLDPDADATLTRLPYGDYVLRVEDALGIYQPFEQALTFSEGFPGVTFTLQANPASMVTLDGTTSDSGSAEGAVVSIYHEDGRFMFERWLDSSTDLVIPRLPYGAYSFVVQRHEIYESFTGVFTVGDEPITVTFTLLARDNGTVTFSLDTGDPGSHEGQWLTVLDSNGWYVRGTSLDANNAAIIPRLLYGDYQYSISATGLYPETVGTFTVDEVSETVVVTIVPAPHGDVTISVSTSDGGSAALVRVELFATDGSVVGSSMLGSDHVVTFTNVIAGDYTFRTGAEDIYRPVSGDITVVDRDVSTTVVLEAQPFSTLTVHGTTSDGEVLPAIWFTIQDDDGNVIRYGTIRDGRDAILTRMPHGTYRLVVGAQDIYSPFETEFTHSVDASTVSFELQAQPNTIVTLDGSTTDGSIANNVDMIVIDTASGSSVAYDSLNANNDLILPRLPAGTYTFSTYETFGVYEPITGTFVITGDSPTMTVPFELVGHPAGRVTLDGSTSDGLSANGANVTVSNGATGFGYGTLLDANNDAILPRLPDGTYDFVIRSLGTYAPLQGSFTIAGADQVVTFTLQALPQGSLTVRLITPDGLPATGLQVIVHSPEAGWSLGGEASTTNEITWDRLAYGTYEIYVQDPYGVYTLPDPVQFDFTQDKNVVDLPLVVSRQSVPGILIDGTTSDEGNPSGAYVVISSRSVYVTGHLDQQGDLLIPRLPRGSYNLSITDPTGVYGQIETTFDVAETTVTVAVALDATSEHGQVTFTGSTSDGGVPDQVILTIETNFRNYTIGGPLDESLTMTFPRIAYGTHWYQIWDTAGDYAIHEGFITVDSESETVVFVLSPDGTATPIPTPSVTPVTPSPEPSVTPSTTPVETTTPVASETPTETVTPSPSPSVEPSVTPIASETPSPSPSITPVETTTPVASVTPSPEPSVTPSTTPVETTTPVASETPSPSVTPETPEPSTTPVETTTPVASETPVETTTPVVTETPIETTTPDVTVTPVTPSPSAEPSVTPEPTGEAPLETSFTLCGNEACAPPHNTGADGFTASWTVTEETETGAMADRAKLASVNGGSGSISLTALQQDAPRTWIITAVIQGGVATGLSEPLPLGNYRVCLNPVLTGPDGSTIVLPNVPPCDAVRLTEDGVVVDGDVLSGDPVPFRTVIIGAPEVIPPAETPGQDDDPAAPADPDDESDGVDAPAGVDTPSQDTSGVSGVTRLPNTGAGANRSPIATWMLAVTAAALMATAVGIRHRSRL